MCGHLFLLRLEFGDGFGARVRWLEELDGPGILDISASEPGLLSRRRTHLSRFFDGLLGDFLKLGVGGVVRVVFLAVLRCAPSILILLLLNLEICLLRDLVTFFFNVDTKLFGAGK